MHEYLTWDRVSYSFCAHCICLFVILVICHFGFESGICLLIAPVPLITFCNKSLIVTNKSLIVTIWGLSKETKIKYCTNIVTIN